MDTELRSELRGWRVAITGASGGIGRALVEAFAREGCALGLLANRGIASLRDFVSDRFASGSVPVVCVQADLGRPAEVQRAFDQLCERLGGLDACVANAGIWPAESLPLHRMDEERIREVIEVDLLGTIWTARAFLQALARQGPRPGGASLLCIGSTAGGFGEPGHAEYAASKAGLRGLVRSLRTEIVALDPCGRVNLLEPGWTATPMAEATLADPAARARALATTPLRKPATPVDVARMAVVLSSPALAGHVSGEIVTVAGGMDGRLVWDPSEPA